MKNGAPYLPALRLSIFAGFCMRDAVLPPYVAASGCLRVRQSTALSWRRDLGMSAEKLPLCFPWLG